MQTTIMEVNDKEDGRPIPDDALSTLEKSRSQEVETNGPSSHHL